jgi:hypothetical protein
LLFLTTQHGRRRGLFCFDGEGLKGNAAINQDRSKNEFAIPVLNTYLLSMVSRTIMDEAKQPEPIDGKPKESSASRIERRDAEIALAMKQEAERHAAVIKNMHRLRALRLSRTSKASASGVPKQAT